MDKSKSLNATTDSASPGLFRRVANFYAISPDADQRQFADEKAQQKYYKRLRMQSFIAATIGYSLYYVCRTGLNVMKKPIIDSGTLNATQLGVVSSALLFTYAVGKFVNGFIADHCNIKRFMFTGLCISALANAVMGILGFASGMIPAAVMTVCFAIMWGFNGWSQSMGAPPAIISLSRWFSLKQRGTYYGIFSASHNLGEFLSFVFVGSLVGFLSWQAGFFGSAIAGVLGCILIYFYLHDHPGAHGLPSVEALSHEKVSKKTASMSTGDIQKMVFRTPAVWILALASAFMYISRYAINGWGMLFLQEQKGFSQADATWIISINALLGILGTVLSGWFSDKLFHGDRKIPALIFGMLNSASLALFFFGGNALWVNVLAMVLFGIAIGVLICFLGGLMAIDIVPRRATGAALGLVGIFSYVAAGIQDVASGILIDGHSTMIDGVRHYDFLPVCLFWLGASILSFILPLFCRKRAAGGDDE